MKIGVSSYSFSKYLRETRCGYLKICDIAKEMGYDGIEFVGLINEAWGITGDPIAIAKEIKEYCAKIGLEIAAYTVGANLLDPNKEESVRKLKESVDIAEALGAPVMRHDVASKLPENHLYTYEDAIVDMIPLIREITEYAEAKGIKTCTENHGFIFQAPERVEQLITAVNHKNYGWLCDMGNFLCVDADPVEAVYIAAPHAFHVHVKDFLFKSGDEPMPAGYQIVTGGGNYIRGTVVGHGVVPVRQCLNILKRAGYEGFVSVEFEGAEENLPALKNALAFLRGVIG